LFNSLKRIRSDFTVFFIAASSEVRQDTGELGKAQYPYSIGFAGNAEAGPKYQACKKLWNLLQKTRPEVVILGGYFELATWIGLAWVKLKRKKTILWFESNQFDFPRVMWKEWLKRQFVQRCDYAHVYGVSNAEYVAHLGMPADRIVMKQAVCDVGLFIAIKPDFTNRGETRRLTYVGRLSPEKNLLELLSAIRDIAKPESPGALSLRLVGYGPQEGELKAYVRNAGLEAIVEFCGAKAQTELCHIFRDSDALVLPSVHEVWGLTVQEGQCAGLPVIVSNRCGCAADVVSPATGWLFDVNDKRSFRNALMAFIAAEKEELRAKGEMGRQISSGYDADSCAQRVSAGIDRALCASRSYSNLTALRDSSL
jgi:glycosyltransferase involved in cell wall biosynthesis